MTLAALAFIFFLLLIYMGLYGMILMEGGIKKSNMSFLGMYIVLMVLGIVGLVICFG